jgi:hypothetical protein
MSDRAKFWTRLLSAWEKSGLTQAEFCRRRGVKAVTFAWWKRRLRGVAERAHPRSNHSTATGRRREGTFTEVMWPDRMLAGGAHRVFAGGAPIVARPESSSSGYEIVLADNLVIRLPGDFDPEKVAQLLGLVVSAC